MKYYLIQVFSGVKPKAIGPFKTNKERDEAAKDIHAGHYFDGEDDCLFWADITNKGILRTGSYESDFLEGL